MYTYISIVRISFEAYRLVEIGKAVEFYSSFMTSYKYVKCISHCHMKNIYRKFIHM